MNSPDSPKQMPPGYCAWSVDGHLAAMIAAARRVVARKLVTVLQRQVANASNSLIFTRKFFT